MATLSWVMWKFLNVTGRSVRALADRTASRSRGVHMTPYWMSADTLDSWDALRRAVPLCKPPVWRGVVCACARRFKSLAVLGGGILTPVESTLGYIRDIHCSEPTANRLENKYQRKLVDDRISWYHPCRLQRRRRQPGTARQETMIWHIYAFS